MKILKDLLDSIRDDGILSHLCVGPFVTTAVVEVQEQKACGVASTVISPFHEAAEPAVGEAGLLEGRLASEICQWALSPSWTEASIGIATLNALLTRQNWEDRSWMGRCEIGLNASELILRGGREQKVALVGHFPFVRDLRNSLARLWVLEKNPLEGDLPADMAPEIVPQADLLAVTSMTLINKTFETLLSLVRPGAAVIVIGPGTPLSPVLFECGVTTIAGARVKDIESLLDCVRQGANFRQARQAGLQLLTIERP